MIFIDRIIRFIKGDVFLPRNCNAGFFEQIKPKQCCDCKTFCRKLPDRGKAKLAPIYLTKRI